MEFCPDHNHKEQYILDLLGYPAEYFGCFQIEARTVVGKLWYGADSVMLSDGAPARPSYFAVYEAYHEAAVLAERAAEGAGPEARKVLRTVVNTIMKRAKEVSGR
jgi:hypothetical protein